MTNLVLTVRGLDGNVIPNTQFKVSPAFPDDTYNPETSLTEDVVFTTDSLGVASLSLPASTNPYYVTRAVMNTDGMIAYKLFVPATTATLTLGMVYVDLKSQLKLTNDKALYTMIESKVSMLVALEQAKTASTAAGLNAALVSADKATTLAAKDDAISAIATAVQRANHTGTQTASTISDFNSAASAAAPVQSVNSDTGNVVITTGSIGAVATADIGNTVCELVAGQVPTNRIPSLAIAEFLGDAASQAAMLALTGQKGDWCIRTDLGKSAVIVGNDPSILAGWQIWEYPAAPVTSVNGQTGTVVLSYSDVGADPAGAAATAQSNAQAYAVQRANHTGTQLAATISDFVSAVAANAPVTSVNARTGAVATIEAIIENEGKQAFIGTDCLEEYTKCPFTVSAANAAIANVTGVNGMSDAVGVWKWTGNGAGDIACSVLLTSGAGVANVKLSAEPLVLIASFTKTSQLSRERCTLGAFATDINGNTSFGGDVNHGFCISLDDNPSIGNGGQWNFRTVSGATVTNTGTISVPVVDDTRYTCVIVATSTSIKFYVNGTLYATHTTNIPTVALKLGVGMYQVAGGSFQGGHFYLDLFKVGRVYKNTPRDLGIPAITY